MEEKSEWTDNKPFEDEAQESNDLCWDEHFKDEQLRLVVVYSLREVKFTQEKPMGKLLKRNR